MKKIIIMGCGGHAKSVCDTVMALHEYDVAGFIDAGAKETYEVYHGIRCIGTDDDLEKLYQSGIHFAAIGIGFMGQSKVRDKIYCRLKQIGFKLPAVVDPSANVADTVRLGDAVFVGKNAVVNADAVIGAAVILNTASLVEHDCAVGDFSHIAVGGCLCGGVKVGEHCLVGANTTIIQEVSVADHTIIGAGSVVTENVPAFCTAAGVPARIIKEKKE